MKHNNKYTLAVSPLISDVFIKITDKCGHRKNTWRKLSSSEVLAFIYQWSQKEAERLGSDGFCITVGDKDILEIKVLKKD